MTKVFGGRLTLQQNNYVGLGNVTIEYFVSIVKKCKKIIMTNIIKHSLWK
jgi:hypothetical protein